MLSKKYLFLVIMQMCVITVKIHGLRLLFMVKIFPCAHQMYILNQITGMKDRGHEVTVISQEKRLEQWPKVLEPYDMSNSIFYGKLPKEKQLFDVILCQFANLDQWWYQLKQQGMEGKTVVFCRGWDVSSFLRKNPQRYVDFFNKTDLWLPVCDFFRKLLIHYGYKGSKIKVLGSSIDCSKFKRIHDSDFVQKNDTIRCTTIARLVPKKGIEFALRAIAQLAQQYKIHYTIVGDGKESYKRWLSSFISRLNIQQHVSFAGYKRHEEIIKILHNTDIYIQPSVTDKNYNQEGIPNALKEAMAMELPVISTYHAGIPELIVHKKTGMLVPEKDVNALCAALKDLIQDQSLRKKLTIAARDQALLYDIVTMNDQLHNMLERLCE